MKWIESQSITNWGKSHEAKGEFPRLIRRLIRATTPLDTILEFPGGKDTFTGGWDGTVTCQKENAYVPAGKSVWELGSEARTKKKAESDYNKRKAELKEYDPSEYTYIFVTPHVFKGKETWRKEKVAEKYWKNVLVYDAANLEEWLTQAPVVSWEFAIQIGKVSPEGLLDCYSFWNAWSIGPKGVLPPSIVNSGREQQVIDLIRFLENNESGRMGIRASSQEEAIAFIVACVKQLQGSLQEAIFAKTLIVDSPGAFKSMVDTLHSLILIVNLDQTYLVTRGSQSRHQLLIPLAADTHYSGDEVLILPKLSIKGFLEGLKLYGEMPREAERLSREAGRNITILKTLLKFPTPNAEWALPEHSRSVIPTLLLGGWDEDKAADKSILAVLAGESYESYINKLTRWKTADVPFVYQIGATWKIASPLDAWSKLSGFITNDDMERLKRCVQEVLGLISPIFELEPTKRYMASLYNKETPNSEGSREGLLQSLILIGVYGKGLRLSFRGQPQSWVNGVISNLLHRAAPDLWASLNSVLPLVAEGSPDSFLGAVEQSLAEDKPTILKMFEEEPGPFLSRSRHTGLLWSLESLAWTPEYLSRTVIVFTRLATLDPGGNLTNRPINSLRRIFLYWMPQTNAGLETRHQAISWVIKTDKTIAWQLLLSLLPQRRDITLDSYKSRWRFLNESSEDSIAISHEQFKEHLSFLLGRLLELADVEEEKLAELVTAADELDPDERDGILSYINKNAARIQQTTFAIWHRLRKILHWHRSFPESNASLPEIALTEYQNLYNLLQPLQALEQYIWLFKEWPEFIEGDTHTHADHDHQQKVVEQRRVDGLTEIAVIMGKAIIPTLSEQVSEKWAFGNAAASILTGDEEIDTFLSEARLSEMEQRTAAQGFIYKKNQLYGWGWSQQKFEVYKQSGYSPQSLASFLLALPQDAALFEYIIGQPSDVTEAYWISVRPILNNMETAMKKAALINLVKVGRGATAIDIMKHYISDFDSEYIASILRGALQSTENMPFPEQDLRFIFENLNERTDFEKEKLAALEWSYLPFLTRSFGHQTQLNLHNELARNPTFFVDVIKWLYKPDMDNYEDDEPSLDPAIRARRAQHARDLLESWRTVPGTIENNQLDLAVLKEWVTTARGLASVIDRKAYADYQIGKVIAHHRDGTNQVWPAEEICEIIDTLQSAKLNDGFRIATLNKRSMSSKQIGEGGKREWQIAAFFKKQVSAISVRWPATASILKMLVEHYESDAKHEDERAEREAMEH